MYSIAKKYSQTHEKTIMAGIKNLVLASAMLFPGLILGGCGGGGSGSSSQTAQDGTVHFSLTDTPACGFDAVNVTVVKVRVNKSATAGDTDAGWTDVTLNPTQKVDLVKLTNGVLLDLGQAPLPAGHYTQTRLVLAPNTASTPLANSVVPTGRSETALDTPSAVQSGIKLNHEFDVAANTLSDFTLDFDACKSVVTRGNSGYGLKPVISVTPMIVSGAINGVVAPLPVSAHPVVSAQLNGVVVKSTVPGANGVFSLSPLQQIDAASGYTVVVAADGYATDVVTGIPVIAKAVTQISTSAAPFSLASSATNSISGSVLPVAAQANLRAIQTYGTTLSTTVTVKSTGADLATGAYAMSLPTAAPMFGAFGTGTLPIIFNSQPTTAGKYAVEAASTGYTTQTVTGINISTAGAAQNFSLR